MKQAFLRYHAAVKEINEASSVFDFEMPFRPCSLSVEHVYQGIDNIARWFGLDIIINSSKGEKYAFQANVEYDGITYFEIMETEDGFRKDS